MVPTRRHRRRPRRDGAARPPLQGRRAPGPRWRPTPTTPAQIAVPHGVRLAAWFEAEGTIVGDGRSWHQARFNAFPSKEAFLAVVFDPARLDAQHNHREVAIADTYTMILRPFIDRWPSPSRRTDSLRRSTCRVHQRHAATARWAADNVIAQRGRRRPQVAGSARTPATRSTPRAHAPRWARVVSPPARRASRTASMANGAKPRCPRR